MNIPVSQLPSGGYGYEFADIQVSPMNFLQITRYLENLPENDPLEKYLYEFSENSSVEGKSAVSIRIASWNASEKKLIQQWWNGDIMLCYNYVV